MQSCPHLFSIKTASSRSLFAPLFNHRQKICIREKGAQRDQLKGYSCRLLRQAHSQRPVDLDQRFCKPWKHCAQCLRRQGGALGLFSQCASGRHRTSNLLQRMCVAPQPTCTSSFIATGRLSLAGKAECDCPWAKKGHPQRHITESCRCVQTSPDHAAAAGILRL